MWIKILSRPTEMFFQNTNRTLTYIHREYRCICQNTNSQSRRAYSCWLVYSRTAVTQMWHSTYLFLILFIFFSCNLCSFRTAGKNKRLIFSDSPTWTQTSEHKQLLQTIIYTHGASNSFSHRQSQQKYTLKWKTFMRTDSYLVRPDLATPQKFLEAKFVLNRCFLVQHLLAVSF